MNTSLHGGGLITRPKKSKEIRSILIVDDDEDNRSLLSLRLQNRKFHVEEAREGQEALDFLKIGVFDLVLLDIQMPVMDGYRVLEFLKKNERFKYIPVIVLSALDEIDSAVKCIELGAEDFLPKPINSTLLWARIQSSLEKKSHQDLERERMRVLQKEMQIGREIQLNFLPESLPQPAGWEVAVSFSPAYAVSGDFYDVFELEDKTILFVVADVCGKGVGAALFMAVVRSLLRAFSETIETPGDLIGVVENINTFIINHQGQNNNVAMFVTFFLGILHPESGECYYINAGHPAPILRDRTGRLTFLPSNGPAVGLDTIMTWNLDVCQVESGTNMFICTDGVTETMNDKMELFGGKPLEELIRNIPGAASELLKNVRFAMDEFADESYSQDDITMLALYNKTEG